MSYLVYLNKILLPVTPGEISIHAPGKNETFELIDGSEVNILRAPGLEEITFDFMLPQTRYPFAVYQKNRFQTAEYYIKKFSDLRAKKTPFQFILSRAVFVSDEQKGRINTSFSTNIKVAIEDLQQKESADNGFDIVMSIVLKAHPDYGTKTFKIEKEVVTPEEPDRPVEPDLVVLPNQRRTYTVQSGDSLWAICATQLGNGGLCWDVARKNNIAEPNHISVGQVIDLTGF
ncbi:LysM peptidoglycan-binding domain-containing protein [Acetobacterium wieringae]|uniref:LysM peptidoglycan-binding domain-containing protein n=1 Tax=Acetobacterium wieringae TaxID=52694 RepID=UPI0020333D1D|nr:LysM domain-containing protein [Acetobacterium wieringae]URN83967.1 LysM peptidoglycan-binding domain-containing protein [Acetobacterium wieringae]